MDSPCPSIIDAMVTIWTALHKQLQVQIDPAEARYLRGVVLGLDDELVARLMAVKLAMSRPVPGGRSDQRAACSGSEVLYAIQGRQHRAQLVHGVTDDEGRLGVGARFGAALIGMRAGQSLLWPHDHGRLVEVHVLDVRSGHAGRRAARAGMPPRRTSCAFG